MTASKLEGTKVIKNIWQKYSVNIRHFKHLSMLRDAGWGLPPCFYQTDNKHLQSRLCSASVHAKLTRLQQTIVEKKAGSSSSPFTVSLGRSKKY